MLQWKSDIFIDAEDIGGTQPRSVYMNIADGIITIRSNGTETTL